MLFRCLTLIISSSPNIPVHDCSEESNCRTCPLCRASGLLCPGSGVSATCRSEVCVVVHHQFQRHKLSSVRCHGHSHAASNESGKRKPALWWALLAPSSDGASAPHQGSSQASQAYVVENPIAATTFSPSAAERNDHLGTNMTSKKSARMVSISPSLGQPSPLSRQKLQNFCWY